MAAIDSSLAVAEAPARVATRGTRSLAVWIAIAVLLLVSVLVLIGPWIAPFDPSQQNLTATLQGPSSTHLLGTDELGRDVLSRLIVGARSAVIGPLVVAIACAVIGGGLGLLAGFTGGLADTVVSRVVDVVYALPALLVAIVIVGVIGGGYWRTALILIILSFPYQARLCRSATLTHSRLTYVDAARTLGLSRHRIMFRHLLPNILPTLLAAVLLDFVVAMIAYAALAYLGIGVGPTSTSWGSMIAQGQPYISVNAWVSLAPALALSATAACATLVGDSTYERRVQAEESR